MESNTNKKQVAEVYTSSIHLNATAAIPETLGVRVEVVYADGSDDEYTIWEYEDKSPPKVGDWIAA